MSKLADTPLKFTSHTLLPLASALLRGQGLAAHL